METTRRGQNVRDFYVFDVEMYGFCAVNALPAQMLFDLLFSAVYCLRKLLTFLRGFLRATCADFLPIFGAINFL